MDEVVTQKDLRIRELEGTLSHPAVKRILDHVATCTEPNCGYTRDPQELVEEASQSGYQKGLQDGAARVNRDAIYQEEFERHMKKFEGASIDDRIVGTGDHAKGFKTGFNVAMDLVHGNVEDRRNK